MKLNIKNAAVMTALTVSLCVSGYSAAQTASNAFAPAATQTQFAAQAAIAPVEAFKSARAASWQGKKLALKGKDVVSFFGDDKPVKGSKKFVADWDNTKWRFASEENRKLFLDNPEKYAPQFGGFCPVALAENKAKIGHVNQYSVVDEKLYLNYNRSSKKKFSGNSEDFLLRAQLNF